MKVAIVAYGHADNVVCLARALSKHIPVTLVFVVSGKRFIASIFDWDICDLPYGLITDQTITKNLVGEKISDYVGPRVSVYVVHTPNRSVFLNFRQDNKKYVKCAARFIKRCEFDVIHFNGSSGFQLYFHLFLRNMPKVYTIHDYLPHSGESTLGRKIINTTLNRIYSKMDYEFIQHYQFLS